MEIRARYVLIGLFVLAVIVGGFGFVYWLNNAGGIGPRTTYRVAFDGTVAGLMPGSPVLFNGLTVGEVTKLGLVVDNPKRVLATIAVNADTPVRADTHVGLDFRGLTGTATVSLVGGTEEAKITAPTDGQPPLLVADAASMKDMTQSARDVLTKIDQVIADNSESLKDAIAGIDSFASALGKNSDKVDSILKGLDSMVGGNKPPEPANFDLTAPADFAPIETVPTAQLTLPAPSAVITLDTQRVMMQKGDSEAPAYDNARWTDNLPVLIQSRIIQGFENAKYLKAATDASGVHGDFQLVIDVHQFRIATADTPTAEVELSAKVIDGDGAIQDSRIFKATAPATLTDSATGAVAALNAAFNKAASDMIVWTLATMAAAPPAP